MMMADERPQSFRLPVHFIGTTQIFSYGFLFYAFAVLKNPLAQHIGTSIEVILTAVSFALLLQALISYLVGKWVDTIGGLRILGAGLLFGALGMGALWLVPSLLWVALCLFLIGVGFAMCTYDVAFSTVIQFDESRSRWFIAVVSFYGGIASSFVWLLLAPLLKYYGLPAACLAAASFLAISGIIALFFSSTYQPRNKAKKEPAPFEWQMLKLVEKKALIIMAGATSIQYLAFAGTALLWISWFERQFGSGEIAVLLAALYGPFQVVGRFIDMILGRHFDARSNAIFASFLFSLAIALAQIKSLPIAIFAMCLYGMGNGVLTIAFGFLTNMYFRSEIFGRAKGIIAAPRAFCLATGPVLAAFIYNIFDDWFLNVFIFIALGATGLLITLQWLEPTNEIAKAQNEKRLS